MIKNTMSDVKFKRSRTRHSAYGHMLSAVAAWVMIALFTMPAVVWGQQNRPAAQQIGTLLIERATIEASQEQAGSVSVLFTVYNLGDQEEQLLGIAADVAQSAGLRRWERKNDTLMLSPVPAVSIPPGSAVRLIPRGTHARLFQLQEALLPGKQVSLRLQFREAGEVKVQAWIQDPRRKRGGGDGHGRHAGKRGRHDNDRMSHQEENRGYMYMNMPLPGQRCPAKAQGQAPLALGTP